MDVNITINVDGNDVDVKKNDDDLKILKKKTKTGRESVLKMPYNEGNYDSPSRILDLMGV